MAKRAINEAVEAYESARVRDGRADLEAFLPATDHPFYLAVLCELVRVELEYSFETDRPGRLEDYELRFPELFRDPQRLKEIAFEEFRLRRQAGEAPSAPEYRDRYGVDCFDRLATDSDADRAPARSETATASDDFVDRTSHQDGETDLPSQSAPSQRRHPRLTSTVAIVAASLAVVAALAAGLTARQAQVERFKARESLDRLTTQAKKATFLLGVYDAPTSEIDEGIALCKQAVDAFGAPADARWVARSSVAALSESERVRARHGVGEILFLWARALAWKAESPTDRRPEQLAEAQRLIASAEASYGSPGPPRFLRLQSADLARLAGRDAEADRLRSEAEAIPVRNARERLILASSYLDRGLDREALAQAEEASRSDPLDFSAWLLRGQCLARLSQYERSAESYSFGIGLKPDLHWAYYHRGRVALNRKDYDGALADFDRFLTTYLDQPQALLNRALANLDRGNARGAIADVDRLLKRADAPTQALFIRAQADGAIGDKTAAEADRLEALARIPADESSWITRGLNRMQTDPAGALEDFRAAQKVNPRSLEAIRNESHVLSEILGRIEDAARSLDQAIKARPQSVPALTWRSVLLARLGRRDEALKDAATSLSLDDSADTLFRLACAFALTSKKEPKDGGEALRLLALAVRKDASRLAQMDTEPDLAPLRDRPEYRRLRDALGIVCAPPVVPN